MTTEIIYPEERHFVSFHEALATVARERIHLGMIEAPALERVVAFQSGLIAKNRPVYYAVDNERVVGWCDATPLADPHQSHRANLGMGLIAEFRRQGLGSRLLSSVLEHAKRCGLEKVELHVYTSNIAAIALYRKSGFEEEGLIRNYRKLDGEYFDCVAMGKFL